MLFKIFVLLIFLSQMNFALNPPLPDAQNPCMGQIRLCKQLYPIPDQQCRYYNCVLSHCSKDLVNNYTSNSFPEKWKYAKTKNCNGGATEQSLMLALFVVVFSLA